MFPTIGHLGPFTIHSYGLMLAIAVLVCTFFIRRDAKALNISPEALTDLIFWVVLAGIFGARVFFIVVHWGLFKDNLIEMIMIQNGGLSWQGSLIAGGLTAWWIIRAKKLPVAVILDLVAPYLALGQAIGRLGCFLNGCCYGKPVAWGIYFPMYEARLHPTQLYDAFGLLIIFLFLKLFQKRNTKAGAIFVWYLFLALSLRFVIEFFRADHTIMAFGLSIYQFVCLIIIAVTYAATRFYRSR